MGKIYIMYVIISGQGRAGAGQQQGRAGQQQGRAVSQSALQVNRESIGLIDTHNDQRICCEFQLSNLWLVQKSKGSDHFSICNQEVYLLALKLYGRQSCGCCSSFYKEIVILVLLGQLGREDTPGSHCWHHKPAYLPAWGRSLLLLYPSYMAIATHPTVSTQMAPIDTGKENAFTR